MTSRLVRAPNLLAATAVLILCLPRSGVAQTVEITPFAGYRFGGDLFEIASGRNMDTDGAPAVGAVVNVAVGGDVWFEALVSHQWAHESLPADAFHPAERVHFAVDHWLAGGRQDFDTGRVRLFLTGLLGLTRYAADDDSEIRFAVSAGGGMRWPAGRHLAVRLDGRVFTTFVDADGSATACGPRGCLVGLDVDVAWQYEFTAGLSFGF
jgi:hypothetical protein